MKLEDTLDGPDITKGVGHTLLQIRVHMHHALSICFHGITHSYGKDYEYDAPVKLLVHLYSMEQSPDEQLVVVSQVFVADINIGYEVIVTQVAELPMRLAI